MTTSLAHSTMVVQAAEYTRYEGRPEPATGGFDHPGTGDDTWIDGEDGLLWRDGDRALPVCRVGLAGTELAEANDLTTTLDHPGLGPLVVCGQLIGGAGAHPLPPPSLDEHGAAIRSALASDGTDPRSPGGGWVVDRSVPAATNPGRRPPPGPGGAEGESEDSF